MNNKIKQIIEKTLNNELWVVATIVIASTFSYKAGYLKGFQAGIDNDLQEESYVQIDESTNLPENVNFTIVNPEIDQIDSIKDKINKIVADYKDERKEMESLLEQGVINDKDAMLIFPHMISRAETDIVNIAKKYLGNDKVFTDTNLMNILEIEFKEGATVQLYVEEEQQLETAEQVLAFYKALGFEDDQKLTVDDIESFNTSIAVDPSIEFTQQDLENKAKIIIRLLENKEAR